MIHFNNDKKHVSFNDRIYEKDRIKEQISQIIEELSEEDLLYYLEILKFTVRSED